MYKRLFSGGRAGDQTAAYPLSLTVGTDGAPVFKSTNSSVWPLYACVNELPVDTRYI